MTEDVVERRAESWWRKQINVGNLLAVGAVIAGLVVAQTRAEMTDVALAQRIGAMESRLDKGEFMRSDVATEKLEGIKSQIADVKDQMANGFARVERALR